MSVLFLLLLVVCVWGLIKPFKGLRRKHFGIAAAVSFVMVGITAPDPETTAGGATVQPAQLSPDQARELAAKNKAEIDRLSAQVKEVPSSDLQENQRIYARLAELAPGNTNFAKSRDEYARLIEAAERYEDNPEEALEITSLDWAKGGFGSIMTLDVTLKNHAPFAIKDFAIRCVHQGASGTDMDRNTRTIYDVVPANGSKSLREINMGFIDSQAVTTSCEVADADRA